jgi:tryptophan 7-halogenase
MKKRIAVVGTGTAGIISLSILLSYVTNNWDVVSVYDPTKPILGIGESTNPNFVGTLQEGTQFNVDDLGELHGTLKFGTKYRRWRENDFVNPLFGAGYAIHFDNFTLKDYCFKKFYKLWPEKFKEITGSVTEVVPGNKSAKILIDNRVEEFDYIVDCRGFPPDLSLDYVKSSCSPVNHCVVYSVPPENQEMYTDHIAMNHGWMFGIPLTTRTTYGYLFNDTMSNKADVIKEMSEYLKIDINEDKIIEYNFTPFYTKKIFEGRVLKNGNRALFFEPLSASSIYMYIQIMQSFIDYLVDSERVLLNESFQMNAEGLEDMISYLYHGGSTLDTEFWQHAKTLGQKRLANSIKLKAVIKDYNALFDQGLLIQGKGWLFAPMTMRLVDEKFGYNYFKR